MRRRELAAVFAKLHETFLVPPGQAINSADPTVADVHFTRLQQGSRKNTILFSCSHAGKQIGASSTILGNPSGIRQACDLSNVVQAHACMQAAAG